jgi:release factor glutamine methyltransferase
MKPLLEILRATEEYLGRKGLPSARVDAEWLVAHALHLRRLELYLQFERPLSEAELAAIRPLLRRRAEGEPLQYILGTAAFHSIELQVGPGVLVPRPETERLVELALAKYRGQGPILDLCTGSGAILLALAKNLPAPLPYLLGVDASDAALTWARRNGELLGLREAVEFRLGDLLAPVERRDFALITANPPYVTTAEMAELPPDVRHEPEAALAAGSDGLDVIRRIAAGAGAYLAPGGWLAMEIGERQGAAVVALLQQHGWQTPTLHQDYNQRDRVVLAQR